MLAGLAIAWICTLGLAPALTTAEVNAALGGQPGVEWNITGAEPTAWVDNTTHDGIPCLSLSMYSGSAAGKYDLATTVTGPGVLELSRRNSTAMTTRILLDGNPTGMFLPSNYDHAELTDRVVVPAGTHTVTWTSERSLYGDSLRVNFLNAKWLPGLTNLPVQLGAIGDAITLSGSWTGQNIWHHGDGGAAWSGLVAPGNPGNPAASSVLRGEFTGPGIISFRCMPRGGTGRVRLDGGTWQTLSAKDVWTRHYLRAVTGGSHAIEFEVPSLGHDESPPNEMLVDELTLLPAINLSVALDTPDLVWNETPISGDGTAYGVEMDHARGAAGVVMDVSRIATPFPRAALVKVRAMGAAKLHRGNVDQASWFLSSETTPDGTWSTRAYDVTYPAGSTETLTLYSNERARVDYVEVVEKPATLAATVGLPPATLTTGGSAPWTVQPVTSIGQYAARVSLPQTGQSAWMEHTVTGPAEINFGYYTNYQSLMAFVNGKRVWTSLITGNERLPIPVRIELPAGEHVVRYVAEAARDRVYSGAETWISSIAVNPLPEGGVIAAALDFSGIISTSGIWTVSESTVHQAATSMNPALVPYGSSDRPRLTVPVTGPGYLRFQTYLDWSGYYGNSFEITTDFELSYTQGRSGYYEGIWKEHPIWIPPGEHQVTITCLGDEEKRLDHFSFTPSQVLPAEDLITGEESALEVDPAGQQWIGMRKQESEPPVIISPKVDPHSPKKLAMTVNGLGRISFKWKTNRRVSGAFLINNVRSNLTLSHNSVTEESESLFIDADGPVRLEWEAAYQQYYNTGEARIELRDIEWIPIVITPFAAALDAPAGLTWTTSPDHPFEGYPTPGAVGGTAANVVLKFGEEAWLETTVEGPGVFDFSVLDSLAKPAATPSWGLRKSVTIDGKEHDFYSSEIPPLLILGEGPHVVRVKFWNSDFNSGVANAVAVDAVTWTPATSTIAGAEWTADAPESIGSYQGMREGDGKDLIVLHPRAGSSQWIERSVTGPGLLSWESRKTPGSATDWRDFSLTIDGVAVAPEEDPDEEWQKHALHLPAGTHTVRFTADPAIAPDPLPGEGNPPPSWQLAAVTFVPGETELMQGVDSSEGLWLIVGPDYYSGLISGYPDEPDDYWSTAGALYLINPSTEHRLARISTRYTLNWELVTRQLESRGFLRLNPRTTEGVLHVFDSYSIETITPVPLADALDVTGEIVNTGWQGLTTSSAYDGADAALSLRSTGGTGQFTREVTGPASVRFRWKSTGEGKLRLSINEQLIQPVPTSEWTEVEYRVNEGTHSFTWNHTSTAVSQLIPSAAWVDALVIESLPARTLDQAAGGSGFSLAASSPSSPDAWKATFAQDVFGQWRDVVRTTSGESILTTTVTGPAVLSFRVGMPPSSNGNMPPPEEGILPVRTFLLVKVGDEKKAVIDFYLFGLKEVSVYVPHGEHQVSWQLMTMFYMNESPWAFTRPAASGYEAWVDDITVKSPRAHYNDWAVASGLAPGESDPKHDADHDGVINFIEYAFGIDPIDPYSTWYQPYLYTAPSYLTMDENPPMRLHIATDFLPAMVKGEFQQSSDLIEWTRVPLGNAPVFEGLEAYFNWGGLMGGTEIELPIESDQAARFFRFQFEIPEE